jgi:hypothetical protein
MAYLKKRQYLPIQKRCNAQEKVGIFEQDKLDPIQAECNEI